MNELYISMYHYTRDLAHSRYPRIKALDYELMKKQFEFFEQNFSVLSIEQVLEKVGKNEPLPKNALLLTFDDGYIDNYTFAMPLLEKYGWKGAFFIPARTFSEHVLLDVNKIHYILASGDEKDIFDDLKLRLNHYISDKNELEELFSKYYKATRFDSKEIAFTKQILQNVLAKDLRELIIAELFGKYVGVSQEILAYELYMSDEQVATLKRHGHTIGLHGYDHYWLARLSENEMRADIDMALSVMDKYIDKSAWAMCYPYGNANEAVLNYARQKGACIGFTTEVRVAKLNGDDDILALPRLDCNDFPPKSENYKSIK